MCCTDLGCACTETHMPGWRHQSIGVVPAGYSSAPACGWRGRRGSCSGAPRSCPRPPAGTAAPGPMSPARWCTPPVAMLHGRSATGNLDLLPCLLHSHFCKRHSLHAARCRVAGTVVRAPMPINCEVEWTQRQSADNAAQVPIMQHTIAPTTAVTATPWFSGSAWSHRQCPTPGPSCKNGNARSHNMRSLVEGHCESASTIVCTVAAAACRQQALSGGAVGPA